MASSASNASQTAAESVPDALRRSGQILFLIGKKNHDFPKFHYGDQEGPQGAVFQSHRDHVSNLIIVAFRACDSVPEKHFAPQFQLAGRGRLMYQNRFVTLQNGISEL